MKKLKVIKITNYDYELKSEDNDIYKLNLDFINTSIKPNIGDDLYLDNQILEEKNMYTYGPIYNTSKDDIIKLKTKNKTIYYQRYYG